MKRENGISKVAISPNASFWRPVTAISLALSLLGGVALTASAAIAAPSGTVAFLMPDQGSTRYEEHDFPGFKAELSKLCSACTPLYQNANANASLQQQQF